jgi:hypothetical protein
MNIEHGFFDRKGHQVPSGAVSIQLSAVSFRCCIYVYFADR